VDTTQALQDLGYDGIIRRDGGGHILEINAFSPTQIKSAIGNIGTFDPENPDIRYSLASEASRMATEARMGLVDAMDRFRERAITGGFQSTNLSLLNRTVGTPFHIAKKFPETFGKVFRHILSYSDTLAQQAIAAERLAPSWFVDLEHGVLKSGESAVRVFRTTKKASMALLSQAINDTTLTKSLLSEAQLRRRGL
jgi:hypothetical protein